MHARVRWSRLLEGRAVLTVGAGLGHLGGRVDAVLLDLEACDYLNAGRSAHQRNAKNETSFGAAVVKMPQWPALRTRLESVGAPFGARFSDADMAEMATWRANQTDMRACECRPADSQLKCCERALRESGWWWTRRVGQRGGE